MPGLTLSGSQPGLSYNPDDFGSVWSTAAIIGADQSLAQPRTTGTVTSNALQSMQGVQDKGDSWGDFWRGALQTAVGYAIQKDAVKSGVIAPVNQTPAGATYSPGANGQGTYVRPASGGLMPLLVIGAVVGLVVVLAKD